MDPQLHDVLAAITLHNSYLVCVQGMYAGEGTHIANGRSFSNEELKRLDAQLEAVASRGVISDPGWRPPARHEFEIGNVWSSQTTEAQWLVNFAVLKPYDCREKYGGARRVATSLTCYPVLSWRQCNG